MIPFASRYLDFMVFQLPYLWCLSDPTLPLSICTTPHPPCTPCTSGTSDCMVSEYSLCTNCWHQPQISSCTLPLSNYHPFTHTPCSKTATFALNAFYRIQYLPHFLMPRLHPRNPSSPSILNGRNTVITLISHHLDISLFDFVHTYSMHTSSPPPLTIPIYTKSPWFLFPWLLLAQAVTTVVCATHQCVGLLISHLSLIFPFDFVRTGWIVISSHDKHMSVTYSTPPPPPWSLASTCPNPFMGHYCSPLCTQTTSISPLLEFVCKVHLCTTHPTPHTYLVLSPP